MHAVVARNGFPSQKCKKLSGLEHFLTFRCHFVRLCKGCRLHYTTLHHTTRHYTTPCHTILPLPLLILLLFFYYKCSYKYNFTTFHPHYTISHYITLRYTDITTLPSLQYNTTDYTTVSRTMPVTATTYIAPHCNTLYKLI